MVPIRPQSENVRLGSRTFASGALRRGQGWKHGGGEMNCTGGMNREGKQRPEGSLGHSTTLRSRRGGRTKRENIDCELEKPGKGDTLEKISGKE